VSQATAEGDAPPKKSSKMLLFALIGALVLGGGSFYAVFSGMVALPFGLGGAAQDGAGEHAKGNPDDAAYTDGYAPAADDFEMPGFVAVDPIVISLGPDAGARHLKVTVQVETAPDMTDTVAALTPRIADVLNTFLRAVDARMFERPSAMVRLRAQMLRRVQLVSPPGAVRDILVQEFVLN